MTANDNQNSYPSYAAAYATLEQCVFRMNRAGPGDLEEADAIIREAGRALAFCRERIAALRETCREQLDAALS